MKKRWLLLPLVVCLVAALVAGEIGLARWLTRSSHQEGFLPPPWLFVFDPPHPISGHVPLQQAFAEGARGVKHGGDEYPIYAVAWLAQGTDNGEAIVQFAKTDPYLNQVFLDVNPGTGDWEGGSNSFLMEAPCHGGTPVAPYGYLGPICGVGFMQGSSDGANGFWTAPVGKVFLVDRFVYSTTRPTGATLLTVAGASGWLTEPGLGFTAVVVPLAQGQRLVVVSNAEPTRTLAAARVVMAHLDQCLPLATPLPQPTSESPF